MRLRIGVLTVWMAGRMIRVFVLTSIKRMLMRQMSEQTQTQLMVTGIVLITLEVNISI